MKVKNIPDSDIDKAIHILSTELSSDPIFLFYTKKKGKEHRSIMKTLINLDLKFYSMKRLVLKGVYNKDKLIGAGFIGKNRFSLKASLIMFYKLITEVPIQILFRMLKSGYYTRYDIFPNNSFYLAEIAIKKEHQRKGHGSKLLQAFYKFCKERKVGMGLITDKTQNIKFYKKNGFNIIYKNDVLGITKYYFYKAPRIQS